MSVWDDKTADWYAENYGDDPSVFAVVRAAGVQAGEAVLDVGCGTGSGLRSLIGQAGALTGVDPAPRFIDIARAAPPVGQITYAVASAEALPVADASQDVVLAINAVHHWDDQAAGLAEAFRVLRPGGRLVLGGEVFDEDMVPEGQDYAVALTAAGFGVVDWREIPEGFVTTARKPMPETPTKGTADV